MIFGIFYQVFLTGLNLTGFLNRTGAEIGYYPHKKYKKSFNIIEDIKKYRKCPALRVK